MWGKYCGFLSLVSGYLTEKVGATQAAVDFVLRRKAIGAEALAAQRDAVLGGKYPLLKPSLRELTTLRMQIAQKTLAGAGVDGIEAHRKRLAEWNTKKEQLEAELARQVPEINITQKLRRADHRAVSMALPEDAALVEFVRFSVFDFKSVPGRREAKWKPAHYLAFVLRAGEPDNPRMIDLGEADAIDDKIATFRTAITGESEIRGSTQQMSSPASERTNDVGRNLRSVVFDPLLGALGSHKRLLFAPDGDLSRVPFEVLPWQDGRYLIDDYHISYLSSGRDALRFRAETNGAPTSVLVMADPDFDLSTSSTSSVSSDSRPLFGEPPTGRQSRNLGPQTRFDRLPATRVEGERVAEMFHVLPCLAGQALEGRIKNCVSPRILHLATHGFFLPDQETRLSKEAFEFSTMTATAAGRLGRPGIENPLLRSGLALAGANTWLCGGLLPSDAEDGLLTAEDVSGLNLLDTEMVVLSACETGLGEVRIGEGVFGLRRAFVLAGTRALVMSLWKIPDDQTQQLMEEFYRLIREQRPGQTRSVALRAAQLMIKEKYSDPYYWGAFIYQGDPYLC